MEIKHVSTSPEAVDVSKKTPKKAAVVKKISFTDTDVRRYTLRDHKNAYANAIDFEQPERNDLLSIYENAETDPHVRSCVEIVTNAILQSEFVIKKPNGDIDEEVCQLFKKQWFYNFASIVVESINWGYSTIEFEDIEDDEFVSVKSINRKNIDPKKVYFKPNSYEIYGSKYWTDLRERPYSDWIIHVQPQLPADQYHLGKYLSVSKMQIIKNEMYLLWSQFNELFVAPRPIGKTNINDEVQKQAMFDAIKNMESMGALIIDIADEVEFMSSSSSSGNAYENYSKLISFCDQQISKAIIGSTMLNEDGSSRSQAEVHENTATRNFEAIKKFIVEPVVNNQLIPMMQRHGMPVPKGHYFEYKEEDNMGKMEWAELITKLGTHFDISDTKFVEQMTGVPVGDKQEAVTSDQIGNTSKMADYYKNVTKEWQQHQERYKK